MELRKRSMYELRAHFHGRVQAVGFRATTVLLARQLSLKGYVKNCPDGTVEVVAQGQKTSLETLISKLKETFHIEQVDAHYVKPTKIYSDFSAIS